MIQIHWWYDRTFYQTFHLQANFLILARVPYVYDRIPDLELEIFAYVLVQTHHDNILGGIIYACFIVDSHGFGSAPVQSIACM